MDVDFDWTTSIVTLILRLEVNDLRNRRQIYDSAYAAQRSVFEEQASSLAPEDVRYSKRLLRYTITAVESDIRGGIDIAGEGYAPSGLEEIVKVLSAEREVRFLRREVSAARTARLTAASNPTSEESLTPSDKLRLDRLWAGLAVVDTRPNFKDDGRGSPITIVRALLIQNILLIASDSRIAILWTLIQPAVMLTIISLMYFLIGAKYILNMDVPTFALIGSITWIMCRQVIFRVSGSYAHHRMWIHIPVVKSLYTTISQAFVTLITFTFVFIILLTAGHFAGLTSLPNSLPRFISAVIGMWLLAYGVGLIFGVIACFWPYFLRLCGAIERSVQIFSSLMFVSEQLPEDWKPYVLWLPTAHGMQLVRAGYFAGYSAPDASVRYFVISIAAILLVGLFLERFGRARLEPL